MPDKDLARLLDDEGFLNYCFGRNPNDERNWNKYIEEHPDEAVYIETLKRTVIMMAKASQKKLRDKHFEQLQQKIAGVSVTQPARKKNNIPAISAAAILLIITGIVTLYMRAAKPVESNIIAQKNDIKPGGNKAVLTLTNGQKISLTNSVNGQIAVQSGIKIKKTAQGQIVYELPAQTTNSVSSPGYNTIEAPIGGQWEVVLPDRSKVWLNARSSLTYPTFFTGKERKVKLKGEAYFEIAHNAQMPFRVVSKSQTVEVLGTHFNIMAYDDEAIMKTTLLEGSVKISDNYRERVLIPGQQAQVSDALMNVTSEVDLEEVIGWKNGYFKFNESMGSIMRKIARWYDVEVIYAGNADPAMHFGGKISRAKNLSSTLKIMELTDNIHFKVEGRRVIVMQ